MSRHVCHHHQKHKSRSVAPNILGTVGINKPELDPKAKRSRNGQEWINSTTGERYIYESCHKRWVKCPCCASGSDIPYNIIGASGQTEPDVPNPVNGQEWVSPVNGCRFIYDGTQWIEAKCCAHFSETVRTDDIVPLEICDETKNLVGAPGTSGVFLFSQDGAIGNWIKSNITTVSFKDIKAELANFGAILSAGDNCGTPGANSAAFGLRTCAPGDCSFALGCNPTSNSIKASGVASVAIGVSATDVGDIIASGSVSTASGYVSDGGQILAVEVCSVANGYASGTGSQIIASGVNSCASGYVNNGGKLIAGGTAGSSSGVAIDESIISSSGNGSYANGCAKAGGKITCNGDGSCAAGAALFEFSQIDASGPGSCAVGYVKEGSPSNLAHGLGAYCRNISCQALGDAASACGYLTQAKKFASTTHGQGTISNYDNLFVCGSYNNFGTVVDPDFDAPVFVVGCGASDGDRKDGLIIDVGQNVIVPGSLTLPNITTTLNPTSDLQIDSNGVLFLPPPSSQKYKDNIKDLPDQSEKISQLRPVSFEYKSDPNKVTKYGLIAEEVDKIYPEFVIRNKNNEIESVHYASLIPLLLSEIQRLSLKVSQLEQKLN
jgi:hypothetical protein